MRPLRTFVLAFLPVVLASCYMSQKPLITPDKAVFPYETIVYMQGTDEKPVTLTHEGDTYIQLNEKGEKIGIVFMPVGDDFYVAQLGGKMPDGEAYLYALVKLDVAAKKADAYAMVASKDAFAAGLAGCPDGGEDTVCLTDLDAYVEFAKTKVGADKKPDAFYMIKELK